MNFVPRSKKEVKLADKKQIITVNLGTPSGHSSNKQPVLDMDNSTADDDVGDVQHDVGDSMQRTLSVSHSYCDVRKPFTPTPKAG